MRTAARCYPILLVATLLACSTSGGEEAAQQGVAGNAAAGSPSGSAGTSTAGAGGSGVAGMATGGSAGSAVSMGGAAGTGGTPSDGGGAAGAAGSIAMAGTAGMAGAGGMTAEIDVPRPSMGCMVAPDITPGDYQQSELAGRSIWVRLPDGYDETRAYPLIFMWKGCGGAGQLSILHMEEVAGADAIIVHGDTPPDGVEPGCYDTADGATFVDLPFFDAFYEHLATSYCVDQAHVYSAGFSSGAWLTFLLGCQRADVIRAIGTIAGGFKPTFFLGQPECTGQTAAFMISDLSDTANPFHDLDMDGDSVEIGVNQWLTNNACGETTWSETAGTPVDPDMNVCRSYADCGNFPVQLCLTDGQGHSDQGGLSIPGFWAFFSQFLPP